MFAALCQGGEVDVRRHFLAVDNAPFIYIERDKRKVSHARIALNGFEDADERVGIAALQGG